MIFHNGRKIAFGEPKNVLNTQIIREVFRVEAYITRHAKNYDMLLIVPVGNLCADQKTEQRINL